MTKKIFLPLFAILFFHLPVWADTLIIPPAAYAWTDQCSMPYPASKIAPSTAAGTCYVYTPIDLPEGTVISSIDLIYYGANASCVLRTSLRSHDGLNYTLIDSDTLTGTTAVGATSTLTGTTLSAGEAYYIDARISGNTRCYLYGIEVTY